MTDEQRQEIERLDRWLAVQEVTRRRFQALGRGDLKWIPGQSCAMVAFIMESGPPLSEMFCSVMRTLAAANDASGGDPKAVRAVLHELYQFLTETPAPTEVLTP